MTADEGQYAPKFLGRHGVTVASDGRIRLPKRVIDQLKAHGVTRVWLCAVPGLKALIMCPDSHWGMWVKEAKRRFPCLRTQDGVRTYLAPAEQVSPDQRGRIAVPPHLRDYAELRAGRIAVVVGMETHFELWNRDALEVETERRKTQLRRERRASG